MALRFNGLRAWLPSRRYRIVFAVALLFAGITMSCARTIDERGAVHVLTADATVNPVLAGYIDRGIDEAERTDARAVVIKLDTPGGLVTSMEDIVQRIQSSDVPVIVYVSPAGGKAASAGTFITMSAHVAAMAPGTRIGAAHPVGAGGEDIEGTLGEKVENDAAAYARAIAAERGRNAEWAEAAVRDSVSASATEAAEQDIVDFVARDVEEVLQRSEGRTVQMDGVNIELAGLADAKRVANDMTLVERLLLIISDPNIAFLFLALGGTGLLLELLNPGIFFPGVFGSIMLVLAFFSLGTLPVNWAGVALIGLAFVLLGGEMLAPGIGALGVGGVIALIAGGLLLTTSDQAEFEVSRVLLLSTSLVLGVVILGLAALVIKARAPDGAGRLSMVGQHGVTRSALRPDGHVWIHGERWRAVAEEGYIARDEAVTITGANGLTLRVRRRAT